MLRRINDDLVLRLGAEAADKALKRPHVRPMDFTGRPLKGYVYVAQEGVRTEAELRKAIQSALDALSQNMLGGRSYQYPLTSFDQLTCLGSLRYALAITTVIAHRPSRRAAVVLPAPGRASIMNFNGSGLLQWIRDASARSFRPFCIAQLGRFPADGFIPCWVTSNRFVPGCVTPAGGASAPRNPLPSSFGLLPFPSWTSIADGSTMKIERFSRAIRDTEGLCAVHSLGAARGHDLNGGQPWPMTPRQATFA